MTTETPRTPEELLETEVAELRENAQRIGVNRYDQLKKAEAEVERLTKELAEWDYGTRAKREQDARKKGEAEIERLKSQLKRAVEIAEMFSQVKGLHYQCNCAMCQLLGDLKGELK